MNNENSVLQSDVTRKQIRGSSVLLFGKILSIGLTLIIQLIMVRYLTKADYGAWGYVMVIVIFLQNFSILGLKNATKRFVPIYQERGAYSKLFGSIFISLVTILSMALIFIVVAYGFRGQISHLIEKNETAVILLLIMVFWVPVLAIDEIILDLLACFSRARAIFIRRYLLAPLLRLSVVILCAWLGYSIRFIAFGYLAASILGILIFSVVLFRVLGEEGLTEHFNPKSLDIPVREIFAFAIPIFASDLLALLWHSIDTLMLGYFHGATEVASYQVILPAARLNQMVLLSFGFLFMPMAARFIAKNDAKGLNQYYWQTTAWVTVLSFPLVALTVGLAKPLTLLLFGEQYQNSSVYLQILAISFYFGIALGFNGMVLKVTGRIRYIMAINVVTTLVNFGANVILIPRYGALGAAVATAGTMVLYGILKHAGLRLSAGMSLFDREYGFLYSGVAVCVLALYVMQRYVSSDPTLMIPCVVFSSFIVVKICPGKLAVMEIFPELIRVPFVRFIIKRASAKQVS